MKKLCKILTCAALLWAGCMFVAGASTIFNFTPFDGGIIENDPASCGYTNTKIELGHSLTSAATGSFDFQSARTGHNICSGSYTLNGYSSSSYTNLISTITFNDFLPNDRDATSSTASATASFDSSLFYELELNGCDLSRPISIGESTSGTCSCYGYEGGIHNYCYGGTFSGLPYLVVTTASSTPPAIYFQFPTNGATSTPFDFWTIGFSNMPTSTYDGAIQIFYAPSGSSSTFTDTGYFSNYGGAPAGASIFPRVAGQLWLPGDPVPETWAAWAVLTPTNTSTTPIDTGATIFFDIYPVGASSSSPPTTTNCNYTSSTFLYDPVGNIQQGICQAFVYLFIPGPAQQSDLAAHLTAVRTAISPKPPFGYFFGLLSAFGSIGNGSSTIVVWTADLTDAFSVILNPVDTIAASVVGILFVLWLLHKIGIIQL
jgi:hypothetical protein